jgi:hypothetical protein
MLPAMRRATIPALALLAAAGLFGCATPAEQDNKPVPPQSSTSRMPWNRPQPGEGQAQFGGMLERR